jgi:hypothetical protein
MNHKLSTVCEAVKPARCLILRSSVGILQLKLPSFVSELFEKGISNVLV